MFKREKEKGKMKVRWGCGAGADWIDKKSFLLDIVWGLAYYMYNGEKNIKPEVVKSRTASSKV